MGFYVQLFCSVALGALSSFGIILQERRALIVAVCVVCLVSDNAIGCCL